MTLRGAALLVVAAVLLAPAPAYAAGPHTVELVPVAGILGSVFGGIGHALLGAFSWTIGLASKFVLTTIAALVKLLIPHSWLHQGLQIMRWIVAVPDYAGRVTSPGGGTAYGFAGVNALRDVFMWLGVALAPLALVYATGRAMIGEGDPVGIPVLRMLAVSVVIVSYPYWWGQAAALADQVTNAILSVPEVSAGLYKLMDYAVDGVALGGWQLVDLGLMGAIALELLGLIFLKVVLILLGALLYATGPLMIGLVPTRAGGALARAWSSAVFTLLGVGVAWATLFAVGALLIGDAGTAGSLVAGSSAFGSIAGGLLLAVAGLASLWLCLKVAKEAGSLLRMQLSGLLVSAGTRGASSHGTARARTSGSSLRSYGSRLARAAGAANAELALAGDRGAALASTARAAGFVARRGLIGTAASSLRAGASTMPGSGSGALGHTRAGAVASRMARAGSATWIATGRSRQQGPSPGAFTSPPAAKASSTSRGKDPHGPSSTAQPAPPKSAAATAPQSVSTSNGAEQSARRTGPVGGGGTRSQNGHAANSARPDATSPPSGGGGRDQRSTPTGGPAPPPPTSRHSSSPAPRPPAPSPSRKPASGEGAPVDKPEQPSGKRPGRRSRRSKRGGR